MLNADFQNLTYLKIFLCGFVFHATFHFSNGNNEDNFLNCIYCPTDNMLNKNGYKFDNRIPYSGNLGYNLKDNDDLSNIFNNLVDSAVCKTENSDSDITSKYYLHGGFGAAGVVILLLIFGTLYKKRNGKYSSINDSPYQDNVAIDVSENHQEEDTRLNNNIGQLILI